MATWTSGWRVMVLLVLASGPGSIADERANDDATFESRWPAGVERVWVGPEHWANRLQDWRVRDARLECVEGRDRFPLRTLHLLTHRVDRADGTLEMRVRTGPVAAAGAPSTPRGWRGFLLGAGGPHVDYRLTALVHHRPAEDGGLLAVVDDLGRVALRDNGGGDGPGGQWSVAGPLDEGLVPEIEPDERIGPEAGATSGDEIDLVLNVRVDVVTRRHVVVLTATDAATGRRLSEARWNGLPAERIAGGLALVSHLGPEGGRAGYWFERWRVEGEALRVDDERRYGPVLCMQHTVSRGVLKLTAQMPPLGRADTDVARLEARRPDGGWVTLARERIVPDSWTCTFRVDGWDASRDTPVRVVYDLATGTGRTERLVAEGLVPREPLDTPEFVVASLNCNKIYTGGLRWNHDGIWFPHAELVAAVSTHEPDLLFFAGDQIYEGDLDPAQTRPEETAILDYLNKWYRWCWAFGELTGRTPTVTIPDDHDVYHGNLWGAGGKPARAVEGMTAQDSGGYKMGPRFVNAVHRTQTAHLPDPVDPDPIEQGITVYFTRLDWAGVSFAILADRQFKSSATVLVPEGRVKNGWFQNPDFDPATQADVAGAVLLGERQERFLSDWATDWSGGTWMKLVLSQTLFSNVATLPQDAKSGAILPSLPHLEPDELPESYRLAADTDSNGWPQTGRNTALRELRRAAAVHLAGDQHLGSLIQYGIDTWRDAGFAFCAPAIANTWPRRWYPPRPGDNREPDAPLYTGDFLDGFGNHMTVFAVANPVISGREPARLYDRAPGYGIVRLNRDTRRITLECWPRWVDPAAADARQYRGWPREIDQLENDGREPIGWLPRVDVADMAEPVVQVVHEGTGTVESARRLRDTSVRLPVFRDGRYTLRVGEPGTDRWRTLRGLRPSPDPTWTIRVRP